MYRVEDKYYCSEQDLRCLQAKLETVLKPDINQAGENGYQITSVYFDDLFDTHLQDTVDGIRFREKYRIRIYNNSFETIKLEVKYKRDNKVLKKSKSITYEQMQDILAGKLVKQTEQSLDNPVTLFNIAIMERGLRPKVVVEYDRKAYVFEPSNVRITLDRNIRASRQITAFSMEKRIFYEYAKEIDRVLEVKYDEFLPGFIAGILETGNMNQISYSKYRLCREVALRS